MKTAVKVSILLMLTFSMNMLCAIGADAEDQVNITVSPELYQGLEYRSIGPYRGGRVTAGTGVPGNPYTFYMGSTGGGVWKTEDAGTSWFNISDKYFKAGSIGAVAVADSDPNVIYVGTGSNAPRGNISPGDGFYKSTDAGKTWRHAGLPEAGQVSRIRIHPEDPDLVYAAVLGNLFAGTEERGVFRSSDGGESWEKVLFLDENTGAAELAMDPTNPRILYASMWSIRRTPWTLKGVSGKGGLFKSDDGGDSWERLKGGFPESVTGKIGVAVSPAESSRVWALVENEKGGVYRSDDYGESWARVNSDRKLQQRAWYYSRIYADPQDADTVYALNTSFYKSIDGGKTFQSIPVLHGDCHDLWINPGNPKIILQTNDGGAHVSLNGGETWSPINNQPTAEIYRVTVDNQFPYRVYGAQQDNSTISVPSSNPGGLTAYENWFSVGGCESGHIAIDPRDDNIIYAGCYGGSISRVNLETDEYRQVLVYPQLQLGQAPEVLKYRFQWNAPIRVSRHDPTKLFHTSQVVHMSENEGQSWKDISPDLTRNDKSKQKHSGGPITLDNTGTEVYGTIFAFEESPHREGEYWAGSDDGLIHISRDSGQTWDNITPEALPEWATVNMIELSSHSPGRAFAAVHNYRLGDFRPYIFMTGDHGETWTLLTDGNNGIPADHFTRVVREDPDKKGLLYAGTEFGLYVSFNEGRNWQKLQLNLPATPVTDLAVHRKNLVVATQGRSFWILDDLNVLQELEAETSVEEDILFTARPAYRAFFQQAGDSIDNVEGSSPPNGAVINFFLAEEGAEEVELEILDREDNVLRTFSGRIKSDGSAEPDEEADNDAPEIEDLKIEKGLNHFVWNLRHRGVEVPEGAQVWGFTGGQLAVPGGYQVRVQRGEWSAVQPLMVLSDPRIDTSQAEFEAQFEMAANIKSSLSEIYDTVREIRSVREQVKRISGNAEKAGVDLGTGALEKEMIQKLTAVEEKLIQTRSESGQDPLNFPPMLDNQFAYLYGYVAGGNDAPTEGAATRFSDLQKEWEEIAEEYRLIMENQVKEFSRAIEEAGLPRIVF